VRHLKKRKKLGGDYDYRRALLKNLVRELFIYGKIKTTTTKARAASRFAEKLITKVKKNDLNGRRALFACFQDQHFVNQIADQIVPRFKDRPGGITRIKKLKRRRGDNALVVVLEFVDGKGGVKQEEVERKKGKKEEKEKRGKEKDKRKSEAKKLKVSKKKQ